MDSSLPSLIILLICIAFSGFFSASETAYTGLNKVRLKAMANSGSAKAEKVLALAEDYDRLLSGILIGNNIVNIASASLATVLFVRWFGGAGVTLSTVVTTIVVLMFGEIAPKSLAKQNPERIALALYTPLSIIVRLFTPLIFLFGLWQKVVHSVSKPADDVALTDDELITMVEEAESEGEFDAGKGELIRSAIEFSDQTAEDILTPRVHLTAVEISDSADTVKAAFSESGYSRLPVYRENVDDIVGILHEKDFFNRKPTDTLWTLMKPPLCVVPTASLSDLLRLFQQNKTHMAVVLDEYGGVTGIVTMEDVLEELVGEIWDEHDEVIEDITKLEDGSYRVLGSASLDDLREVFDISEDFESVTVNGWVLEVFGHFPQSGEQFTYKNLQVTVEKSARKSVEQIRIVSK